MHNLSSKTALYVTEKLCDASSSKLSSSHPIKRQIFFWNNLNFYSRLSPCYYSMHRSRHIAPNFSSSMVMDFRPTESDDCPHGRNELLHPYFTCIFFPPTFHQFATTIHTHPLFSHQLTAYPTVVIRDTQVYASVLYNHESIWFFFWHNFHNFTRHLRLDNP